MEKQQKQSIDCCLNTSVNSRTNNGHNCCLMYENKQLWPTVGQQTTNKPTNNNNNNNKQQQQATTTIT